MKAILRLVALVLVTTSVIGCDMARLASASPRPIDPSSQAPAATVAPTPGASAALPPISFRLEPLAPLPQGASEPALVIGPDGSMIVSAGGFERDAREGFAMHFWSRPSIGKVEFQGSITTNADPLILSGRDSDLVLTERGTLIATTTVRAFAREEDIPRTSGITIATIRCPAADPLALLAGCEARVVDGAEKDRPWIATGGTGVWIAYRDDEEHGIVVERSSDDGLSWERVGLIAPTSDDRARNVDFMAGSFIVDAESRELFVAFSADASRGGGWLHDDLFVVRGIDGGETWREPVLVHHESDGDALNNVFASLAIDESTGSLFLAWSDGHEVSISRSTDAGQSWDQPMTVSSGPVRSVVMPIAVSSPGELDIAYYGTDADIIRDTRNEWRVYLSRSTDGGRTFAQTAVNPIPNHKGQICLGGDDCDIRDRLLLDLFEMAVDPTTGKVAIAYTDTASFASPSGEPLPQVVLALEQ
jgi:hypothetical protein